MKKNIFILSFLLVFTFFAWSKAPLADYIGELEFINNTGMYILGGWALANIGTGSTAAFLTNGDSRYFHMMNAGWNLVNLGIAGFSLFGSPELQPDLWEVMNHQQNLEKAFLFNTGLDVGYIGFGLFMMERAKTANSNGDLLRGFGTSVVVQGGFLLLFDVVMFILHNQHATQLKALF